MSATAAGSDGRGERGPVTVLLPKETVDRLMQYCIDHRVTPDEVVERALLEYFREGDMSH
jgi:hypothetical protein